MTDTLYLSSVNIQDVTRSTQAKRNLSDMKNAHRFVMSLFGDLGPSEPRAAGGILFRLEEVGRASRLLIQSNVRPETDEPVATKDASAVLGVIQNGRPVRFRLLVNPVRRDAKTKADRPIPVPEVEEWIANKLDGALALRSVLDLTASTLRCGQIRIAAAQMDAEAVVVDADQTRALVAGGVGRRKSHGCGLLSIVTLGGDDGLLE